MTASQWHNLIDYWTLNDALIKNKTGKIFHFVKSTTDTYPFMALTLHLDTTKVNQSIELFGTLPHGKDQFFGKVETSRLMPDMTSSPI